FPLDLPSVLACRRPRRERRVPKGRELPRDGQLGCAPDRSYALACLGEGEPFYHVWKVVRPLRRPFWQGATGGRPPAERPVAAAPSCPRRSTQLELGAPDVCLPDCHHRCSIWEPTRHYP